jgi:hypothetical protein
MAQNDSALQQPYQLSYANAGAAATAANETLLRQEKRAKGSERLDVKHSAERPISINTA